jgi:hypothetical protein
MAAHKASFHQRFNIDISLDEAQKKFVERAHSRIFGELYNDYFPHSASVVKRYITDALGRRLRNDYSSLANQIGDDFHDVLQALEGMYVATTVSGPGSDNLRKKFNEYVNYVLRLSEVDLGIRWAPPHFQRAGAEELDRSLVNENLLWLRKKGYETVVKPFEKALRHLMESQKRPELRADVITDMYEALEALAKKATGKDLDLAKNTGFIDAVKASAEYRTMLANFIGYANRFRHAAKQNTPRPTLSERETESFVYLTGLFIRLAMPE